MTRFFLAGRSVSRRLGVGGSAASRLGVPASAGAMCAILTALTVFRFAVLASAEQSPNYSAKNARRL